MVKNIFFDFDGVIADSVNVKTDAFYNMYLPYGTEIAEKVKQHHIENGGMSRFKKFALYYKDYLGIDLDNSEVNKLAEQFSKLVLDGVVNSSLVNGITKFLGNYYNVYKFWIVTGTPVDEIKIILDRKNLYHFFIEAVGSPASKIELTKLLIEKNKLNRDETCFIGDALADYEAAKSNSIKFILRQTPENLPLFINKENIALRINDFINFNEKLILL